MKGTFFLGVGGQKCGSTWYRNYIASQEGSDFGRLGEYQVWEYALGGPFARYRTPEPSGLAKLKGKAKHRLGLSIPRDYLRWRMQTNRHEYFDYFTDILSRPGIKRTGDVSPSYAALPATTLRAIRDGFEAREIRVKVIFAMRDPVARLRSHLKMDQEKGYRSTSGDEVSDLKAFFASEEADARMRYDLTLDALEAVFPPINTHICLFEGMIRPKGVVAISKFAEFAPDPGAGKQRVNSRESGRGSLPDELEAEIVHHYKTVYSAVARRFPQIDQIWPSARHLSDLGAGTR